MSAAAWISLCVGLLTGGAAMGTLWLSMMNSRRNADRDAVSGAIAQLESEVASLRRHLADVRERNAKLESRYGELEERLRECERERTKMLLEIKSLTLRLRERA